MNPCEYLADGGVPWTAPVSSVHVRVDGSKTNRSAKSPVGSGEEDVSRGEVGVSVRCMKQYPGAGRLLDYCFEHDLPCFPTSCVLGHIGLQVVYSAWPFQRTHECQNIVRCSDIANQVVGLAEF